MDVEHVFHMNDGDGEASYAQNSFLPKTAIQKAKHAVEKAIQELYCTFPDSLSIADLGCSSGPNTLLVISEIIDTVDGIRLHLKRPSPEFRVFLNDLPSNDFNTLFRSLPGFYEKLKKEKGDDFGSCYVAGVPGSFYGRLFPYRSLHFVHSSYCLHWLSRVPPLLETENGIALNKGNICIGKSSHPLVSKAYSEQFDGDFSLFLTSRSLEIVEGGKMVITLVGRTSPDPCSEECRYVAELLALALDDMVSEERGISEAKTVVEESVVDLYCTSFPKSLCLVDMGCSSGPNTLLVISIIMDAVDQKRRSLGHSSPEFQVFLNDLPGNDFNTIFMSLPGFYNKLKREKGPDFGPCYFAGVPGSFYGRLFPTKSLDFVHSSFSVHWLSQVPPGLQTESGGFLNKGHIYIAKGSPPTVFKAYLDQFQRDFSLFLRLRSEEMKCGGHMVLTLVGRRSPDPSSGECCLHWELMAQALMDMVSEGIVEEAKVDSFNLPYYSPSVQELTTLIEIEGSFHVDRLKVVEINWDPNDNDNDNIDKLTSGQTVMKIIRAGLESMLAGHFGETILDDLYKRYGENVAEHLTKEKSKHVTLIISMSKKSMEI